MCYNNFSCITAYSTNSSHFSYNFYNPNTGLCFNANSNPPNGTIFPYPVVFNCGPGYYANGGVITPYGGGPCKSCSAINATWTNCYFDGNLNLAPVSCISGYAWYGWKCYNSSSTPLETTNNGTLVLVSGGNPFNFYGTYYGDAFFDCPPNCTSCSLSNGVLICTTCQSTFTLVGGYCCPSGGCTSIPSSYLYKCKNSTNTSHCASCNTLSNGL